MTLEEAVRRVIAPECVRTSEIASKTNTIIHHHKKNYTFLAILSLETL